MFGKGNVKSVNGKVPQFEETPISASLSSQWAPGPMFCAKYRGSETPDMVFDLMHLAV